MSRKYKIVKQGNDFAVWVLKDYGSGSAYDLERKFSALSEAEAFVEAERKKTENEGIR